MESGESAGAGRRIEVRIEQAYRLLHTFQREHWGRLPTPRLNKAGITQAFKHVMTTLDALRTSVRKTETLTHPDTARCLGAFHDSIRPLRTAILTYVAAHPSARNAPAFAGLETSLLVLHFDVGGFLSDLPAGTTGQRAHAAHEGTARQTGEGSSQGQAVADHDENTAPHAMHVPQLVHPANAHGAGSTSYTSHAEVGGSWSAYPWDVVSGAIGEADEACAICLESLFEPIHKQRPETLEFSDCTHGTHVFHRTCITTWLAQTPESPRCPMCRETYRVAEPTRPESLAGLTGRYVAAMRKYFPAAPGHRAHPHAEAGSTTTTASASPPAPLDRTGFAWQIDVTSAGYQYLVIDPALKYLVSEYNAAVLSWLGYQPRPTTAALISHFHDVERHTTEMSDEIARGLPVEAAFADDLARLATDLPYLRESLDTFAAYEHAHPQHT